MAFSLFGKATISKTGHSNRVCPYCIRDLPISKLMHWCPQCETYINARGRCPKCEHLLSLACRWVDGKNEIGCGRPLPKDYTTSPTTIIAVVGGKQVGKTQYLTVLMNYIRKSKFTREFNLSVNSVDDSTASRYLDGSNRCNNGETVDLTDSIIAGGAADHPFIYTIRNKDEVTETIVIYDTAGEDLAKLERIQSSKIELYLRKADSILLLVDPLQMVGIRNNVSVGMPLPPTDEGHDNKLVLERVTSVIRSDGMRKIKTNLAVVLTKIDLLRKDQYEPSEEKYIFKPGCDVDNPRQKGMIDVANMDAVSSFIESYLNRIDEGQLVTSVLNNYESYHFFATSALGQAPDQSRITTAIDPIRVEDPFLWALQMSGSKLVKKSKR